MPHNFDLIIFAVLQIQLIIAFMLKHKVRAIHVAKIVPPVEGTVSIVRREAGAWVRVGERPHDHPDVVEAFNTPGLALMNAAGKIVEGIQRESKQR